MCTVPEPAGAVAVTVVAFTTETFVAAVPSNSTTVVPVRFVPVIVTAVPPPAGPDAGEIDVTVGTAIPVPFNPIACVV